MPQKYLKEILAIKSLGMSQYRFAMTIGMPYKRLSRILLGHVVEENCAAELQKIREALETMNANIEILN